MILFVWPVVIFRQAQYTDHVVLFYRNTCSSRGENLFWYLHGPAMKTSTIMVGFDCIYLVNFFIREIPLQYLFSQFIFCFRRFWFSFRPIFGLKYCFICN